jgi:rSAM/selenodomain-associated transferase 1
MNRALLVIAKRPAKGQTKTRLSPPFSGAEAAQLYECFLQDMLDIARAVPNVAHIINYWPAKEADYFKQLAPDFDLIPQMGDTLGQRLDNVLTHCLTHGFDQVVITNSDSPTLPATYLHQAFELLNQADVVLGPCDDGGYYLIGLTRPQPSLLREVEMSTPTVIRDTLDLAEKEGLRAALLPNWYDVDTVTELDRLAKELQSVGEQVALHTRDFLRSRRI